MIEILGTLFDNAIQDMKQTGQIEFLVFEVKKENQPYVFEYYSKGLIAMIMKWVDLDCEKPIDELIGIITDTFSAYKKPENTNT